MLYSAEHNVIVYPTDNPLPIVAGTKDARPINGEYVGVPATYTNIQLLQKLGLDTPNPLELDTYDWPCRGITPKVHQKTTAGFLTAKKRAFCLSDMGAMKTLSALWAADYLMEMEKRNGRRLRCIIVAPLSILESVWQAAILRHFLGRRKCVIVHGTTEKRRKLLERDVDFYIINFDGIRLGVPADRKAPLSGLAADIRKRTDIRLGIIDEASAYRHATNRRHRAARILLKPLEYLWLLTGTPTSKGPENAYGLAKLINDAYGESFTHFRERACVQVIDHINGWPKWVPRHGGAAIAAKLLSPSIRYSIEDIGVDLPPCTTQQRSCALSDKQRQAFKALHSDAIMQMESGGLVHAVNEAVLRLKLIQVCAGAIYDGDHMSHDLDPTPRIEVVQEIVEECAQKVVIAAPLTNVLHLLHKKLDGYERAIVNGQVDIKERFKLFKRFGDANDPLRVLLVDPATVAHGINDLVTASVVIWFAPTDMPEHYNQLNKRIDRPGQRNPTTIVQIAATSIERDIYDRLGNQQTMQGLVLEFARKGLS